MGSSKKSKSPKTQPAGSSQPATHVLLTLEERDAVINMLGEVPLKYGVEGIVALLRKAGQAAIAIPGETPTRPATMNPRITGGPRPTRTPPNGRSGLPGSSTT